MLVECSPTRKRRTDTYCVLTRTRRERCRLSNARQSVACQHHAVFEEESNDSGLIRSRRCSTYRGFGRMYDISLVCVRYKNESTRNKTCLRFDLVQPFHLRAACSSPTLLGTARYNDNISISNTNARIGDTDRDGHWRWRRTNAGDDEQKRQRFHRCHKHAGFLYRVQKVKDAHCCSVFYTFRFRASADELRHAQHISPSVTFASRDVNHDLCCRECKPSP